MKNVVQDFLQLLRIEIDIKKLVFDLGSGKLGKLQHL